ncbi:hypothetical protein [Actinomadura kijaniata]|uniref:hypothetical protein n=1 Tax=Actinomadura kijaniata TaxID=46161 RepID=UPI0012FCC613|nr:hypothetical protein [Actinomadura kijaniata]
MDRWGDSTQRRRGRPAATGPKMFANMSSERRHDAQRPVARRRPGPPPSDPAEAFGPLRAHRWQLSALGPYALAVEQAAARAFKLAHGLPPPPPTTICRPTRWSRPCRRSAWPAPDVGRRRR